MKSTVDPSDSWDGAPGGRRGSGSTAAQTTEKKRKFTSTKQRIEAQLSSESKPLQAPIDEIANPLSAASSQDDEEVLSPEEKIIQLNLEKKKSLRKIEQRRDIIGDEVAEKMKK